MKVFKYEMFFETIVGIKFIEIIKWLFLYSFIELLLPLLLDPLGLFFEYGGYESDDIVEFIFFIIIPLFVVYYIDEVNGYSSLLAFFLYVFLTTDPIYFFSNIVFNDFFNGIMYLLFFIDTLPYSESETISEEDVLF